MKKTEFQPFQWAEKGFCDNPQENPGELVKSILRQCDRVIKENHADGKVADLALDVMNIGASTLIEAIKGLDHKPTDSEAQVIRETIVRAYLLGTQSTRLALATSGGDASEMLAQFERDVISEAARRAANARHNRPGGSRDLKGKICASWATGNFTSRDICAEQEWQGLGFASFSAARKALRNTPDPT